MGEISMSGVRSYDLAEFPEPTGRDGYPTTDCAQPRTYGTAPGGVDGNKLPQPG